MPFAAILEATDKRSIQKTPSARVIQTTTPGGVTEQGFLSEWAAELAAKFAKKPKNVALALNHAVRNGTPAFGLTFTLVSGKPYPVKK